MGELESKLLQTFLEVVVSIGAAVLVPMAIAYGKSLIQSIRLKMSAEQLAFADSVVAQFVKAAEQYNLGGLVEQMGAEKKQWVIEKSEAYLAKYGVKVDLDVLADMVEAAVLTEINKDKKVEFIPGALD